MNDIDNEPENNCNKQINKLEWLDFEHNLLIPLENDYDGEIEHAIIQTTIYDLLDTVFENWEHNRPPDMTRIPEIVRSYKKSKIIDGLIYIAKIGENYICYDGIHRLSAIPHLRRETKIIMDIMKDPDDAEIISKFKKINKSNPVPELYINGKVNDNVKNTILQVVSFYYNKYSKTINKQSFFSSVRTPNVPNENRDTMIDKLYELTQDGYELCDYFRNMNYQEWLEFLERKNNYFKDLITMGKNIKLSKNQINKCSKDNNYLFCCKDWHTKGNTILLHH